MEDRELEDRLLRAEQDAAAAKALAERALATCEDALVVHAENESRLKSIQHRVDKNEGKMGTVLNSLSQISNAITESNGIQAGTRRAMKTFMALVSIGSLVLSFIRVLRG